jgi:hypothetical protein
VIDLALVLAFVGWSIATGLRSRREASRDLESYFLAGRKLSSWERPRMLRRSTPPTRCSRRASRRAA